MRLRSLPAGIRRDIHVVLAIGFLAIGCAEPVDTWRNVYDVSEVEIGQSDAFDAIGLDGDELAYNAFASALHNYDSLVGPELGTIDERVQMRDGDRRLLWRIWLESERESGAPVDLELQPYDYNAMERERAIFGEPETHGDGLPILVRGGHTSVPLGRMFDASATVDPGWFDTDITLSFSYRSETRGTMTGVIGFVVTEQAVREIVVPALTVGLAMVWNAQPESQELQTLDIDDDGQITTADVARWMELLVEPNIDSDGDGEEDSYAFTFGFRATRTCGGNDFGCSP